MMREFDEDDIAAVVKQLYTDCVRIHPSGRYRHFVPAPRWEGVWLKAASQCLEHNLDPEALVHSVVDDRVDAKVFPTCLLGSLAVEKARVYMRRIEADERTSLQSQLTKLRSLARTNVDVADAIARPEEDFDASFRFAFAARTGLHDIASRFRNEARLELRLHKTRLDVMEELLPPDFVAEVRQDARSTHV